MIFICYAKMAWLNDTGYGVSLLQRTPSRRQS